MAKKSDLQGLVAAVETMRATLYPEVDPGFIAEVVSIEARHADSEDRALNKLRKLVDDQVAATSMGEDD